MLATQHFSIVLKSMQCLRSITTNTTNNNRSTTKTGINAIVAYGNCCRFWNRIKLNLSRILSFYEHIHTYICIYMRVYFCCLHREKPIQLPRLPLTMHLHSPNCHCKTIKKHFVYTVYSVWGIWGIHSVLVSPAACPASSHEQPVSSIPHPDHRILWSSHCLLLLAPQ